MKTRTDVERVRVRLPNLQHNRNGMFEQYNPDVRVRAKIRSRNSRPDSGQIGSIRGSKIGGVANATLRILRPRSGPRWPEDGMRKREVIFARALSCEFAHAVVVEQSAIGSPSGPNDRNVNAGIELSRRNREPA